MYKIEKENLEALFRKIAESQDLILPIKKAGQTNFGLWSEGEEADLETLKTVKSGKDAFFPQSETLYTCVRDGKKLTVEPEELRKIDVDLGYINDKIGYSNEHWHIIRDAIQTDKLSPKQRLELIFANLHRIGDPKKPRHYRII